MEGSILHLRENNRIPSSISVNIMKPPTIKRRKMGNSIFLKENEAYFKRIKNLCILTFRKRTQILISLMINVVNILKRISQKRKLA